MDTLICPLFDADVPSAKAQHPFTSPLRLIGMRWTNSCAVDEYGSTLTIASRVPELGQVYWNLMGLERFELRNPLG